MGEPIQIEAQLLAPSSDDQAPLEVALVPDVGATERPDVVVDVPAAHSSVRPGVRVEPSQPDNAHTIGLLPVWGAAALWLATVILLSQGVKTTLKAVGLKDRLGPLRWKRWMFVVPIIVGTMLGYALGPMVASAFGFALTPGTAALLLGTTSGSSAPWVYMGFRHVILPLFPAVAIGAIERVTGIDLPEELKERVSDSGLFDSPSAVMETPFEDEP